MILSQISWIDCIAFLLFLAPQLLIQVGFFDTLICGCHALPFLLLQLPYQLIIERYFTKKSQQSPWVQHATTFQDVVIRCVRYAFAEIPASVGKVFFSKGVALPFFYVRSLRHGVLWSPIHWKEVDHEGVKGIYMVCDSSRRPDVIVYYCHGGGFSMGSAYFYIEFLLAWTELLKETGGFKNPALFALEYTLVPEATYPTQVQQTLAGYEYVLSTMNNDPSRICVSGDSAGATLVLSLLLHMSTIGTPTTKKPGLAIVISPWTSILSPKNQNTPSDYLNADSLRLYGSQYIGSKASPGDPLVSPGLCKDIAWWRRASPWKGWFFVYGAEEVFAPETKELVSILRRTGVSVEEHGEQGWVHAWPVVKLFLCNKKDERLSGLNMVVNVMRDRLLDTTTKQ